MRPIDEGRWLWRHERRRADLLIVYLLFFGSGFAALVLQVLWVRDLGLLFGNTTQAAAVTLAVFFLGLVIGARYWGGRAGALERPLRAYAGLEAGVAVSAALSFVLIDAYDWLYIAFIHGVGPTPAILLAAKAALALLVLGPPAFCMGGTLPIIAQHLVPRPSRLGLTAARLYGVNTAGAAVGAAMAGFVLPRMLGISGTYATALAVTAGVAALAWRLDRTRTPVAPTVAVRETEPDAPGQPVLSLSGIRALAFLSGFVSLGLEVLWTRMFAQVMQNSVYTFATVLVTFLAALAIGAVVAARLIRVQASPSHVLPLLLMAAGGLVAATPIVFVWATGGLEYVGGDRGFGAYVLDTFGLAAIVMLVPASVAGALFPYAIRVAEPHVRSVGATVGDLAAVNMAGAIAGALAAGFVLLDAVGLWAGIQIMAAIHVATAVVLFVRVSPLAPGWRVVAVASACLAMVWLDPTGLPVVHVSTTGEERVVQVWESGAGIVSVIERPGSLDIKLDNDYSLGGTGASVGQAGQAHLALLLHPRPRSVFFLGLGTGITAGAALLHPVERIVVCELHADVVTAATIYFAPYVHGLFADPRVTVVVDDGRSHLRATSDRYDVISSDLFMPWKVGVGALYSREHFARAIQRLGPDGLYVQWLPLYQVSELEFGAIARTMADVFPRLTLWRGDGTLGRETVALIGHRSSGPLDRRGLRRRLAESGGVAARDTEQGDASTLELRDVLLQYGGDLSAAPELLAAFPVNTHGRPIVEYTAPITHRQRRAGAASWFTGRDLVEFLGQLIEAAPPDEDPYLGDVAPSARALVRAGLGFYIADLLEAAGGGDRARTVRQQAQQLYDRAADEWSGR